MRVYINMNVRLAWIGAVLYADLATKSGIKGQIVQKNPKNGKNLHGVEEQDGGRTEEAGAARPPLAAMRRYTAPSSGMPRLRRYW